MKRLILVAFLSGLVFSASAQSKSKKENRKQPDKSTSQVSTSDQLRQLAIQLQLNEGQYIRFRELNKARVAQIDELNNLYPNDPTTREAKIKNIHREYDAQLAQSLTKKQFLAYLQVMGRAPETQNTNLEATDYGRQVVEPATQDKSQTKPTIKIDKDTLNNSSKTLN